MTIAKTVIITGASSGIGMKLAELYQQEGYKVAVLARRFTPSITPTLITLSCDVTSSESVQAAVNTCLNEWGHIDIAIANAGISLPASHLEVDMSQIKATYEVNLFGAMRLFEAVIPHMKVAGKGHLVSIASLAGFRGAPKAGVYCSSKAALIAFTESLRLDLKDSGIAVTLINPGFIKTPLTDQNRFKMPFLLSLDGGGYCIFKAIQCQKAIFSFPFPMAALAFLGRLMPAWLYDGIIRRFKNDKEAI